MIIYSHCYWLQIAAETLEAQAKIQREKDLAKRRKKREEEHQEREKERDKIRDKYALPPRGASASSGNSQPKKKPGSDEDSKCVLS